MRSYPCNSPQAGARLVALALLADGDLTKREIAVLDQLDAHGQLGLGRDELHAIVHTFCEDLLSAVHLSWDDACRLDPPTLAALMAEIDDAELRAKVLNLSVAVIEADGHVAQGESIFLGAAVEHWGLHRMLLQQQPPALEPAAV